MRLTAAAAMGDWVVVVVVVVLELELGVSGWRRFPKAVDEVDDDEVWDCM